MSKRKEVCFKKKTQGNMLCKQEAVCHVRRKYVIKAGSIFHKTGSNSCKQEVCHKNRYASFNYSRTISSTERRQEATDAVTT